jgi:hypothetical protein
LLECVSCGPFHHHVRVRSGFAGRERQIRAGFRRLRGLQRPQRPLHAAWLRIPGRASTGPRASPAFRVGATSSAQASEVGRPPSRGWVCSRGLGHRAWAAATSGGKLRLREGRGAPKVTRRVGKRQPCRGRSGPAFCSPLTTPPLCARAASPPWWGLRVCRASGPRGGPFWAGGAEDPGGRGALGRVRPAPRPPGTRGRESGSDWEAPITSSVHTTCPPLTLEWGCGQGREGPGPGRADFVGIGAPRRSGLQLSGALAPSS